MGIFGGAFGKIKDVAGDVFDPRIPSKEDLGRAVVGALPGAGPVLGNQFVKWILFGGKPPASIGPGQTTFEKTQQQFSRGEIQTQEQARDVLDRLVGFDPYEMKQAEAVASLREGGGLSRIVDLLYPDPNPYLTPFSPEGAARFSTGSFDEFRDPYEVMDMRLAEYLNDNPAVGVAYLRETDPMSLLPVL